MSFLTQSSIHAQGMIEGEDIAKQLLQNHPAQHLYSSPALPSGNTDLAHPVWSKPSHSSTHDDILLPSSPQPSRSRHLSSDLLSIQSTRQSPSASTSVRSGSSTPAVSTVVPNDLHHYSHRLHQHLALQQTQNVQPRRRTLAEPSSLAITTTAKGSLTPSQRSSPINSGCSSPTNSSFGRSSVRPQVLETHKLELQTHLPTGRRMVNQYIIEEEIGRGVHGKVRLAIDTETRERVAVKIVERESRKRLGGFGLLGRQRLKSSPSYRTDLQEQSGRDVLYKDKGKPDDGPASCSNDDGHDDDDQPSNHQNRPSSPLSSTRFGSLPTAPKSSATSIRYGRWADAVPSRPTYVDREAEKQKEKETDSARKALLWTTDQKVRREIAIMKKCCHENVVSLREVIDDPQSKKIFMILEYMEGGEIVWKDEAANPTLTVDEARRILRDVVCGLEYLHYQGIIHRDIKPANLLWDKNKRVKISDFGVSHFSYAMIIANANSQAFSPDRQSADPSLMDDHELAKTAGSPAFFAPELCMSSESALGASNTFASQAALAKLVAHVGESPSVSSVKPKADRMTLASQRPRVTKAIDVWALGVTLYCLLFGHTPFTAESEYALFSVIPTTDYTVPTFMGADRVRVGPRKPRWKSRSQWVDEEGDVQPETPTSFVPDANPDQLPDDAKQLLDLLDRLLEKNPTKRITLEEVKKHPWVTKGLQDPPAWLSETDPHHHPFVEISHADVEGALTGLPKLKQKIKRWQSKLFDVLGGGRRRSRSVSQLHGVSLVKNHSGQTSQSSPIDVKPVLDDSAQTSPMIPCQGSGSPPSTPQTPKAFLMGRPPSFFSRRQSTQSMGKGPSVEAYDQLNKKAKERSDIHEHYVVDADSVSHSRPTSPLVFGDAAFSLRQLSQASPNLGTHNAETALMQPPIIQRRSSSKSYQADGNTEPYTIQAQLEIPQRRSSDSHTTPSSSSADRPMPRRPSQDQSRSSKLEGEVDVKSLGAGAATKDGNLQRLRASTESASRSSISPSQTSRASNRNRLGDFLRGSWLHVQDGRRRSVSKQHSYHSREAHSPTPQDKTDSSSQFSITDGFGELSVDAEGTTRKLGPMTDASVSNSVPLGSAGIQMGSLFSEHLAGNSSMATTQPCLPQMGDELSIPYNSLVNRASSGQRQRIDLEHDDVDLDLELSDDDLDDDGRIEGPMLTNNGSGWVVHQNDRYMPEARQRKGSDSSSQDILTPSVEGGYNVFKPPYQHILSQPTSSGSDHHRYDRDCHAMSEENGLMQENQTFALDPHLSTEAEALRRAAATGQEIQGANDKPLPLGSASFSRSSSQKSRSNDTSRSQSRTHSRMEALFEHQNMPSEDSSQVPTATDSGVVLGAEPNSAHDDQFADAEEDESRSIVDANRPSTQLSGQIGYSKEALPVGVNDDDCDSDEMCVSFKAKKSSRIQIRASRYS